MLLVVSSPK